MNYKVDNKGGQIEYPFTCLTERKKKMKKQDKNRLTKKDRRLIKKAMLKAAAKGCDEVYRIAEGLKDGFELLGRKDG